MTPPEGAGASWEQLLVQMIGELRTDVRDVSAKIDAMVPRPEFEAAQRGIDRRFEEHARLIGEKQAAHARLEASIQAVDDKVDAQERDRHKWSRDLNSRVWLAILGGGVGLVGGAVAVALGIN